jgi:hypothetical protein
MALCNVGSDWSRYRFRREDLFGEGNDSFIKHVGERGVPVVLDWAIRNNGSCKLGASGKHTAPACLSTHSSCENTTYGGGYVCNCSKGYEGNPYMADHDGGCTSKLICFSASTHPYCCSLLCEQIILDTKSVCSRFQLNMCLQLVPTSYVFSILTGNRKHMRPRNFLTCVICTRFTSHCITHSDPRVVILFSSCTWPSVYL